MKKFLLSVAMTLGLATTASADYTLIVPQEPGKGTSVWSEIIARNLSRFTDEPVVIRHIPGARDIPGFNKFFNELMFDDKTIMESVAKTHKVLIVDEGWRSGSISAEISARIMEQAFYELDSPVERLCRDEVPMPYAKHLEDAALPQVDDIVKTVKTILNK